MSSSYPLPASDVQTEQRFQTLFEQAPFSVQLLSVTGRTLKVNQAWKDLWGTQEGDPLYEFVLTEYDMLSDPQLEAKGVTPQLRRAFAGEEAVRLPAVHYDPAELGKPGLARWVEATARPIKAPDGTVVEVMLIHEDVTERLLAERRLRASEAQFRTIADAMPQMVWSTLPDGYHDYYNLQWYAFTGVPQGSTDGEAWNGMFHPEDQPRAWELWRHSLETGAHYEIEYRLRHHSGEYRWVLGRALPVREQGEIVRWMGTCTDIHEQKQARDELLAINRRKDDFLAMLAHELRNPLAPISTAAQLLKAAPSDAAQVERAAAIIERQVRHMTELVDDLLDVSRVTRGLVELERGPVELKSVLGSAIEQVRPLIEARGHRLTTRMAAGDVYVLGDRTRLVQVVSNLLNNAAKYTPQNGSVLMSMAVGEQVEVRVADTGMGIEAQLIPEVFELFTQGARTPDRAQGGLGLGLALVKTLVELHGGHVKAESDGPGQGSAFTVTLPVLKAGPAAVAAAHQRSDARQPARPLRIMVVDDNADAAETLGMVLESLEHEVRVLHDPEQALAAIGDAAFDVFILDIGLPGMDGYSLARLLRAHRNGSAASFIALTGYGSGEDRHRGADAGFDHYLVKPADLGELARLLQAG